MAKYEVVKCCRNNGKPKRYWVMFHGRVAIVKMTSSEGEVKFFAMDFNQLPLQVINEAKFCGNCGTKLDNTVRCSPIIIG